MPNVFLFFLFVNINTALRDRDVSDDRPAHRSTRGGGHDDELDNRAGVASSRRTESSSTTSLDDTDRFRVAVSFEGELETDGDRADAEPAERKCINERTNERVSEASSWRRRSIARKGSPLSLAKTAQPENEGRATGNMGAG